MTTFINPDDKSDILGLLSLLNSSGSCGSVISGHDVAATLAHLPEHVQNYAFLLAGDLKIESAINVEYCDAEYMVATSKKGSRYTKRVDEGGVVAESESVTVISSDFYRVRNMLAAKVGAVMLKDKVTPKTANLEQYAKGIAGSVLYQRLNAKRHCSGCQGRGWQLVDMQQKKCTSCDGKGQARYTLAERLKLTGLKLARQSYQQTWQKFEEWADSELANWDNQIRGKFIELVRKDQDDVASACQT